MIRRHPRIRLIEAEREKMRAAGKFNAELLDVVREHVKPGVTTGELDKIAHEYTLDNGTCPLSSVYS